MMPVDHFPSTHATWLDAQLTLAEGDGDGSRHASAALRRHLMERYREPLVAYVRGGSMRRLGDANELVDGFFADRACRPAFLGDWRASGMPLRRWMMNGIGFYGRGIIRDRARERARDGIAGLTDRTGRDAAHAMDDARTEPHDAEHAFERAWALSVLNDAHDRAHAELAEKGRLDDYEVFRRHVIEGEGYETIGPSLGRSVQQCAGATRLVKMTLQRALHDSLRAEGVPERDLESEAELIHAVLSG